MAEARREWLDRDYYKDLGLTKAASDDEIQATYKKLVRKLHPDRNPGNKTAENRFKEVSSAYEVIGNSSTRKQYDQMRQAGVFGADDLFSGLFRNGMGGDFFGGGNIPTSGIDYETSAELSFDEAMAGTVKTVPSINSKSVKVRIPAGVGNNERIKIPSKGGQGVNGGPRGDLYVRVSVKDHHLYKRQGQNLLIEIPISFQEAALGTEIKVPTYGGKELPMRIPAGTQSEKKFRIKGHGVPTAKGKKGDLVVKVKVDVPQKLNAKQKKAIQELGDLFSV